MCKNRIGDMTNAAGYRNLWYNEGKGKAIPVTGNGGP
jgi:hypothetical protein